MKKKIKCKQVIAWGLLGGGSTSGILGGLYGGLPSSVEILLSVLLVLFWGFIIVIGELRYFTRRKWIGFESVLVSVWVVVIGFVVPLLSGDGLFGLRVGHLPFVVIVHIGLVSATVFAAVSVLIFEMVERMRKTKRRLKWTSRRS